MAYRVYYKDDFGDIVAYSHDFAEERNAEKFDENCRKLWESIGQPKRMWVRDAQDKVPGGKGDKRRI